MKNVLLSLTFITTLFSSVFAKAYDGMWTPIDNQKVPAKGAQVLHPKKYRVCSANSGYLKQLLFSLPASASDALVLELPLPDGGNRNFRVWQKTMMPAELEARYPGIKTFTAEAVGNRSVTAKIDFTELGFHAMIFDGANTVLIDPYSRQDQDIYIVRYIHDEYRTMAQRMTCAVSSAADKELRKDQPMVIDQTSLPKLEMRMVSGYELRTYRLALSADSEYCAAATGFSTPTIAQALSCMTTTMNRVNGIYEREFSITMQFVAREDTLIWTKATGTINGNDPFNIPTNIDGDANACIAQNQIVCDTRIGSANYDIGHVFTTGAGGYSYVQIVCGFNQKARSVTGSATPVGDGFDVDYVAHEMGHEFGADHTFNNNIDGFCGGNADYGTAYEPGSGSTIMAYAGICSPDDLQMNSDPYFAAASLAQIYSYAVTGAGNSCPMKTTTNNKPVGMTGFTHSYAIPYLTPFELMAPSATDSVADTSINYCWEQYNLGDAGARFADTHFAGPIFRSFNPSPDTLRVFPKIDMVLAGTLSNAGTEGNEGEKVPDTARYLTFRMTVRDIYQGNGCFLFPDDSIHLNVINTGAGFSVIGPGANTTGWTAGSSQTVTWNVVNTNVAPINCDSVDIYLSVDGGYHWPYLLASVPNSGSANVTVPGISSSSNVRVKVKGKHNVFFNVNTGPLSVIGLDASLSENFMVYPVPARDILHINVGLNAEGKLMIHNAMGQCMWNGQIESEMSINVKSWPKGIYFVQLFANGYCQTFVKSIIIY